MSNFVPPSENGKTIELDFRELIDHPLLAGIPMWPADSAEALSIRESIGTRGLDYALLVDNQLRIVDGRNRRNAIRALGGLGGTRNVSVPCRIVDEHEAATVIVSALVNRRHLSKGAIAYVCAPMFEQVLAESKARRADNLRKSLVESKAHSVCYRTAEDVAAHLGIGTTLFDQALRLRTMFAGLSAEDRAKYEPRVLGPWADAAGEVHDPVGLGYMINGLTSLAESAAALEKSMGKRSEHDRLFVAALPKLQLHWDKADEGQRAAIAGALRTAVLQFPAELREEIAAALKAAAKADHA